MSSIGKAESGRIELHNLKRPKNWSIAHAIPLVIIIMSVYVSSKVLNLSFIKYMFYHSLIISSFLRHRKSAMSKPLSPYFSLYINLLASTLSSFC